MKLTDREIRERLNRLTGWVINKNRLEKTFVFPDFTRAVLFVNKIVNPIEEHQNYPRILITYNRVTVSLFNNEVGRLTQMDFDMAQELDAMGGIKP